MASLTERMKVGSQEMALYVAVPSDTGLFPAIVVIQHGGGVDTFVRTMVDRLATAGYAAVAPDLYHRLEPGVERTIRQLKDLEIIADVQATVDFLQHHNAIDSASLGITGFCMGGRVTYLMAAALPQFKAAVAYYGGNIMVPWGEGGVAFLARTNEMHCPLMFHFGEDDTNPFLEDMRQLDAALTRDHKEHVFYTYPNAGHAFMDFTNAERHREAAATASWPRTLDFFARHLRGVPVA